MFLHGERLCPFHQQSLTAALTGSRLRERLGAKLHTTLFTGRRIQVVLKTIFRVDSEELPVKRVVSNLAWWSTRNKRRGSLRLPDQTDCFLGTNIVLLARPIG